jgi:integrase
MKKPKKKIKAIEPYLVRTTFEDSPSAQTTTLCRPGSRSEMAIKTAVLNIDGTKYLSSTDKVVLEFSLTYGLRISEILAITRDNLLGNGRVFINGKKRSCNRILDGFKYYEALSKFLRLFNSISQVYSRFYYYRLFLKLGISLEIPGNQHRAVTHAGRHLLSKDILRNNIDMSDLQRYIGHKSGKSTEYYAK